MQMLNKSIIQLWHTQLDDHINKYPLFQNWLTLDEKKRAEKLALPVRQEFVISRGILRDLLAFYSKQPPEKLKIIYSVSGKPLFNEKSKIRIEFNLSHSKNILIYAFTLDTPLGVDIEYINSRTHLDKIAYRFFPAYEYDQLHLLRGENKLQAFFKSWVRNEALIKAKGDILKTHSSSSFKLSLKTKLSATKPKKTAINSGYAISNLFLYPDFAIAVAVKGNAKPIVIEKYTSRLSELSN